MPPSCYNTADFIYRRPGLSRPPASLSYWLSAVSVTTATSQLRIASTNISLIVDCLALLCEITCEGADASQRSDCPAAGYQIDDQHDYGNHQQKVNHTACDMEAEAESPQDQQHSKDCPEHMCLLKGGQGSESLRSGSRPQCKANSEAFSTQDHYLGDRVCKSDQ